MKCVAIDDEPVALSIIEQFCQRMGNLELNTFTNPETGMDFVSRSHPDIVFLDIEMNGVSGLDLAKILPKGTFLIFTTAYAQFALDGFELDAVDFLHKPFSFSRFEKAVEKARNLQQLQRLNTPTTALDEEEITVKVEYQNVKIRISDIQYIEAMGNYIKIHLSEGRPVLTQMSIKSLSEMLPEQKFARVHKSFIVPVQKVARYTRRRIILHYRATEIPVGRIYADSFIRQMEGNSLPPENESEPNTH